MDLYLARKPSRRRTAVKYVVPSMLSNLCIFLFTVIDGIFVGNGVSTDGLGAVNLDLPAETMIYAVFLVTSVGGSATAAIAFGYGDEKEANKAFLNSLAVTLFIGVIFTVAGVFFTEEICRALGASRTFLEPAADYLRWYSAFSIAVGLSAFLQAFCRNDRAPGLVSFAVITATLCNIFLDWLFIYPMKMGTAGAAIASGIAQTMACVILLPHFFSGNSKLRFSSFKLDLNLIRELAVRGLPECVAQLATPMVTLCLNLVLARMVGDVAINGFSIINYVSYLALALFYGTSEGLQPLFGRCYGRKSIGSLKYFRNLGLKLNLIGSLLVIVLLVSTVQPVCRMFGAGSEVTAYVAHAMPLFCWGFIPMSINVMVATYFYSTSHSDYAMVISVLRSLIMDSLVILIFPVIFGSGIIWYCFGIYEVFVMLVALALSRRSRKKQLRAA